MKPTIGIFDLKSAFGFLPGLDVSAYGGRGICLPYRLVVTSDTTTIHAEYKLWKREGLGAERIITHEDTYAGARTPGTIRELRKLHSDKARFQFFFMGQAEHELARDIGLRNHDIWGPTRDMVEFVGSKIHMHETAKKHDATRCVLPSATPKTADEARDAFTRIMKTNRVITQPDGVACKRDGWASGIGFEFVTDADAAARYVEQAEGNGVLFEAGYRDKTDASIQVIFKHGRIQTIYFSEQIILDGALHTGNLVTSDDQLPNLPLADRNALYQKAVPLLKAWGAQGYDGVLGVDAIGIKNTENKDVLDWRFVDPNARIVASFYPWSVMKQLETNRGGKWCVILRNLWPDAGCIHDWNVLMRTVNDISMDRDELCLPLMCGLLPEKFAVVVAARTSSRATAILETLRLRIGSR